MGLPHVLHGRGGRSSSLWLLLVLPATGIANGDDDDDGIFYLSGTAQPDYDPENPKNEVIRMTSAFNPLIGDVRFAAVARVFDERVKVWHLDNMLEVKHRFTANHSCGIGSPRFALAIDRDGDGDSDGNAFGYVGTSPSFVGCPQRTWLYEDGTGGDGITGLGPFPSGTVGTGSDPGPFTTPNEELEWDTTQLGGPFYNTWSQMETFFATLYPNHHVCAARYVDDFGAPPGTGHADLIVMGDAVLDGHEDIAGRGDPFAGDPCDNDDDDDGEDDRDDDDHGEDGDDGFDHDDWDDRRGDD
jgi:hypothetical protein